MTVQRPLWAPRVSNEDEALGAGVAVPNCYKGMNAVVLNGFVNGDKAGWRCEKEATRNTHGKERRPILVQVHNDMISGRCNSRVVAAVDWFARWWGKVSRIVCEQGRDVGPYGIEWLPIFPQCSEHRS